ncbi:armadillo repeat-containing kinesin-like protein 3 [Phtheirospermum japonicum]|uniref:Armadillo repeat-containing kinesin-like protein 3 n=1 Tax=Phtheirospermum japonicum TaxID=374723 RepID=A0A830BFT4_9LAMI|nr:armadillo repeat-containing kinesin-like protein 3 [Phtheirospermum japonicum]
MSSNSYRNGGSISKGGGGAIKFENYSSKYSSSSSSSSSSFKSKVQQPVTAASSLRRTSHGSSRDDSTVSGRVRVAVRLRPRNSEEMVADADFADCVELQPELKRLKLRKNNWDSDTFEFDEVLTEFASQKRVYEVVAKPVVESVLEGYNGTVMAYGQTGTGKTYTLGRLGEKDAADRGIMLRAMEDILSEISPENDAVCVSYFQLYMETIQDLLNPANDNISIVEDPKSGDVSLPGSEGHTLDEAKSINLSLSALGKCINALAENSAHVPVRDSKLTRLLRDSFGGTARTSLIITIGPSPRHRGETSSTIMFGQRAMKVENMVKIKEEFDYKSLSRRLEIQLDKLIAEHERQQKAFQDEHERIALEAQKRVTEVEKNFADALEEKLKCQKEYKESVKKLEEEWAAKQEKHGHRKVKFGPSNDGVDPKSNLEPPMRFASGEVAEIKQKLQNETLLRKAAEAEVDNLKNQMSQWKTTEAARNAELLKLRAMLEDEECQKAKLEEEIQMLQSQLLQISSEADESRRNLDRGVSGNVPSSLDSLIPQVNHQQLRDSGDGEKASMVKLFEQVGLHKILSLLESEDADVRIHAVKVVANLAAEESNQERIVEAGGLASLLTLLKSSNDETIHRVAAGAIANLAMNETNQELIMSQGDKLLAKLRAEGGIRALLGMVRCRHPDVLAQVARGIANFAKCESRASTQVLIEDGALPWIVQNANNEASPIRRHIELALCHLAQHEVNTKEMITGGALWELVRISRDCSREDIRTLAQRTLKSSPSFQSELKRLRIDYS